MRTRQFLLLPAVVALVIALALPLVAAQTAPAQPPAQPGAEPPKPASPVAKQPAVKSQEEANAVMALIQSAQQDPDARIKAAQELLRKFPNTEFKPLALFFITLSYQEKNDYENTLAFGEQTLKEDPDNIQTLLLLARVIASRVREHDLDKEEKLTLATKYAQHALDVLKTAPRPNPSITDEQWEEAKKEFAAQAYEAYGMIAMARDKTDLAIENFQKALSVAPNPDPSTMVRLGNALAKAGKYDEAIATFEKVMGMADALPQVKQIAQAERARAIQARNAAQKQ